MERSSASNCRRETLSPIPLKSLVLWPEIHCISRQGDKRVDTLTQWIPNSIPRSMPYAKSMRNSVNCWWTHMLKGESALKSNRSPTFTWTLSPLTKWMHLLLKRRTLTVLQWEEMSSTCMTAQWIWNQIPGWATWMTSMCQEYRRVMDWGIMARGTTEKWEIFWDRVWENLLINLFLFLFLCIFLVRIY